MFSLINDRSRNEIPSPAPQVHEILDKSDDDNDDDYQFEEPSANSGQQSYKLSNTKSDTPKSDVLLSFPDTKEDEEECIEESPSNVTEPSLN